MLPLAVLICAQFKEPAAVHTFRRVNLSWRSKNGRDWLKVTTIRPADDLSRTEMRGRFGGKPFAKNLEGGCKAFVAHFDRSPIFVVRAYGGTKDGTFHVGQYLHGTYRPLIDGLIFSLSDVKVHRKARTVYSQWFDYGKREMIECTWKVDVRRGRAAAVLLRPLRDPKDRKKR